jgi:tetratricopeptide (TPR) repeat protein
MKKHISLLSFLAVFFLAFSSLLPSCSDSIASQPTDSPLSAASQIPYLKGRKAGLGTPSEIANVASIYDKQKAILQNDPSKAEAYLSLAELFMNEARITGEHPYYYPAALKMIDGIPNIAAQNEELRFQAAYYRASIFLSMHEFAKGLEEGEKARQIFPRNAGIYGVLIDGNVELGNYEEAVRLSDIMVGMRPDLRSYSRVSYLRELHGDPKGAIEAMEMAVDAAMPGYEQSAWVRLTLGKLHETYGQLDEAKMQYAILLQEREGYPFAYAGLASVAAKQGNDAEALENLDKAIALIPEVSFFEQKVGLLRRAGQTEAADKMIQEIDAMMMEDQASGHQVDLEMAVMQLRIAKDQEAALVSARKALAARPNNIDVNAVMAEISYAMGDYAQAQKYMDVAMRTGSQDPTKNCVAGMIQIQLGKVAEGKAILAKAFENDPYLDHPMAAAAKALL